MSQQPVLSFYCVINPNAGAKKTNYKSEISRYFATTPHHIAFYVLEKGCSVAEIRDEIAKNKPDRVIAVGGDGTVKLVAECLLHSPIPLAIIPAGSANGMAREFDIPNDLTMALEIAQYGAPRQIHAANINGQLCVHLADVGMNAHIIKRFQETNIRGMAGYAKAAWRTFKSKKRIKFILYDKGMMLKRKAEMLVVANGTTYGTGVRINRDGSLFDNKIEIILVKTISLLELIKMRFSKRIPFNPFKTEIIKTKKVEINCNRPSYFQIDGEYIGKISKLKVEIIEHAMSVISK
ncbi:diacylglycerol/lipid kinase family protein [Olivibacter sitiensis]|uniref:diacylglycerol/lipid kinase family protein n=1 Tax=Olivibacter sitiensis TaxID=376470 RepID=UPI000428790B|nr:diacylglycerol kinase family protein [Olivibacter sitiensis]